MDITKEVVEKRIKELEIIIEELNKKAVVKVKQYKELEFELKKLATEMDTKKRTVDELKSLFGLDKKEPTASK